LLSFFGSEFANSEERKKALPTSFESVSAAMSENAIVVENLSKRYLIGHRASPGGRYKYTTLRDVLRREIGNFARKAADVVHGRQVVQGDQIEEFWALKDVSFSVRPGEVLGIIGRNGAGKSTLLKILSRITEPTSGRIGLKGRVSSLLEVGTGFHPELTGRENIYLNGAILGMTQREIRKKFDEIVEFAEVERFLDTPVKHYSSGMYVRLAFAVAAHLEPEILIVDEVLAVGDADFQKKCLGKMDEVSRHFGRTVLLVSHNIAAIQTLSNRVLFLEKGQVNSIGDVDDIVRRYTKTNRPSGVSFDSSHNTYKSEECDIVDAWIEVDGVRSGSPIDWDQEFSFVVILNVRANLTCSPEYLIRDATGVPILVAPTGLYAGFSCDLSPGTYELKSLCAGLRLASGTYLVDVAISHSGIKFFTHYESALHFEISDRAFYNNWYCTQDREQARIPLLLSTKVREL
jgi:lipopolysaccharide transport system ATP-binding protein